MDYPFGYSLALVDYLDLARAGRGAARLAAPVEAALGKLAGLLARSCGRTGFRQMTEPCIGRDAAIIVPAEKTGHGYNPLILAAGVVLAAAGRLLGRAEWTRLAECQLYWVLGFNPRFMSFMNDEGVRHSGSYGGVLVDDAGRRTFTAFYRHRRDLRWGITTGIYAGAVPDYPEAGRSARGEYDCKAQETWLNATGWFLRLLSELSAGGGSTWNVERRAWEARCRGLTTKGAKKHEG